MSQDYQTNRRKYTNLCAHICSCHVEEIIFQSGTMTNTGVQQFSSLMWHKKQPKSLEVFTLLQWHFRHFQFAKVCIFIKTWNLITFAKKSMVTYMLQLTKFVEKKCFERLPKVFWISFNGWISGYTHYILLFATYPPKNDRKFDEILLVMSPVDVRDSQSSNAFFSYTSFGIAEFFWGLLNHIAAIVGDDCNRFWALSRKSNFFLLTVIAIDFVQLFVLFTSVTWNWLKRYTS